MLLLEMIIFSQEQIQEIRDIRDASFGMTAILLPLWYLALENTEQAEVILMVYHIDLFEITTRFQLSGLIDMSKMFKNIN